MLVSAFKRNAPANLIIFLVVSVMIWLSTMIHVPEPVTGTGFSLTGAIDNLIRIIHPRLLTLAAFVLVAVQAVLLNNITSKINVFGRKPFLISVVYVLLMGNNPAEMTIQPVLLANTFLLLMLRNLFFSYDRVSVLKESFNAGFWVSIAALFYYPSVVVIFFVWITFIIYRLGSWREWVVSVIGLITPFYFLLVGLLLSGRIDEFIQQVLSLWQIPAMPWDQLNKANQVFWPSIGALSIFGLFKMISTFNELSITTRKNLSVTIALFLVTLAISIMAGNNLVLQLYMLVPALSVVITYLLLSVSRPLWAEVIFGIFTVACVFQHFVR